MNSTLHHHYPLANQSEATSSTSTINVVEKRDLSIYQLLSIASTIDAIYDSFGIPHSSTSFNQSDNYLIVPLAKGRWLIFALYRGQVADPSAMQLPTGAYLADVSHAYTVLEISGPSVDEFMRKGCRINLNPEIFTTGMCAQTLVAEVSVLLLKKDEQPTYILIIPSGYSKSFWQWIEEAAAEFGINYTVK